MAKENPQPTYSPAREEDILRNADRLKSIIREIEDCRLTQKQMHEMEFVPLDFPSTSKI